jgi:hypothetical protein
VTSSRGELFAAAQESGLLAQAFDPAVHSGSGTALTGGVVHLIRVWVPRNILASNLVYRVTGAASGLTSAFAGVYDDTGLLVAKTADISATYGGTGEKSSPLADVALTPGRSLQGERFYYVAHLAAGTTPPSLLRGGAVLGVNIGQQAPFRFGTVGSGLADLPAAISLPSVAALSVAFFTGVT